MSIDGVIVDSCAYREDLVGGVEIRRVIGSYASAELSSSYDARLVKLDGFEGLSSRERVLVSLFVVELLYRDGVRGDMFVSVGELFERFGLSTAEYPAIRALEQDGLVVRENPDKYALATGELERAVGEIGGSS